ncbi:MAG: hypothetical protein GX291_00575 [Tissierellia bacterium]|jgi:hypothetical protein|nr:hypothetical protein [Bacillota bacterium]NLK57746.1 hypothetical protein [Tissierellia bacterium]
MRLIIRGADDEFIRTLLPLLKTPAILADLRTEKTDTGIWQGDDLPVYNSFDARSGLCEWEDALYDTCVAGVQAVYPPREQQEIPGEETPPPFPACILLTEEDFSADEVLDASLGARRIAAVWNGEQGFLQRFFAALKGNNHE